MNVWVRLIMEKKLVSKQARASDNGTSRAGRVQFAPLFRYQFWFVGKGQWGGTNALLTNTSNLPPVIFSTSLFASRILISFVTSKLNILNPFSSRSDRTSLSRAVAITCNPVFIVRKWEEGREGFWGLTDPWNGIRGLGRGLCRLVNSLGGISGLFVRG
jgi:hypothetical protein